MTDRERQLLRALKQLHEAVGQLPFGILHREPKTHAVYDAWEAATDVIEAVEKEEGHGKNNR